MFALLTMFFTGLATTMFVGSIFWLVTMWFLGCGFTVFLVVFAYVSKRQWIFVRHSITQELCRIPVGYSWTFPLFSFLYF
jgi:hypothetical protein